MSNHNLKTVCENCSANYIVKHDLPDEYIEQYCPFCGEEHEQIEEENIEFAKENLEKNFSSLLKKLEFKKLDILNLSRNCNSN